MLNEPIRLPCGLVLNNRIVKSSMTERMAAPDGRPTERLVRLFERWSQGGAGLLLTGNVLVDGAQLENYGNVTFDNVDDLTPFRRWAQAGAREGVPVIMQLNHPGRQARRSVSARPVAPSPVGIANKNFAVPRALAHDEIIEIVQQFANGAQQAERAGFVGVEIHAAHGYLVSQFLAPKTNLRGDMWGGSLENRARLLTRIIERVRAKVSSGFAVGVKLNSGDFVRGGVEPDDAVGVVRLIGALGVDFIEVSGGTFERAASFGYGLSESTRKREGYFMEFARRAREVTTTPLIVTGGFRSSGAIAQALASGSCDMVGLARPMAVEPDLARRLLADASASAREPRIDLPRGAAAPLAELCWYRQQLEAIADGKVPAGHGSGTMALVRALARDKFLAWQRHRYMRRRGPTQALGATT